MPEQERHRKVEGLLPVEYSLEKVARLARDERNEKARLRNPPESPLRPSGHFSRKTKVSVKTLLKGRNSRMIPLSKRQLLIIGSAIWTISATIKKAN
jgi:hypothetical protein